jgi:hypothetical protein
VEVEPPLSVHEEDSIEEIGRPEGPFDERHIDPFGIGAAGEPVSAEEPHEFVDEPWPAADPAPAGEPSDGRQEEYAAGPFEDEPEPEARGDDEVTGGEEPAPWEPPSEGVPAAETRFGRRRTRRR